MDGGEHRYRFDVRGLMEQLRTVLAERGYSVTPEANGTTWIVETSWARGAAYGEIASMLYGLIADKLVEIE